MYSRYEKTEGVGDDGNRPVNATSETPENKSGNNDMLIILLVLVLLMME